MGLTIWQKLTLCTPAVCASGIATHSTAQAVLLFSLALAAFLLAFLSRALRPMMLLVGGYLAGFAHHIFTGSSVP
jgi:hypothetical protein